MAEGTIGLAEPSTITASLRTAVVNVNGSNTHQEVMTIGGAGSSLQLLPILAAPPASTEYAAPVRIVSGPSTASDAVIRVNQGVGNSTAADRWQVAAGPNSTAWASSAGFHFDSSGALQITDVNPSTGPFAVNPVAGSTWRTQPGSTLWASSAGFHFDSSGALQITGATASTQVSLGLPTMATVAQSTVGNTSTQTVLISSAATTPYITSYVVTSTEAGPIVGGFYVGSTLIWPVTMWADGGVITQTQGPAVAPNFIFAGQASRPLHFVTSSSGVTLAVALTYFSA